MNTPEQKISVYVLAYNQGHKTKEAIKSVLWADEVVVIDSNSKDDTVAIAESLGARVVQVPFKSFGDLRNQAVQACQHEWIFSLDTDERCTEKVRNEILAIMQSSKSADIYKVPRRNYFMGRWIKHSGWYPDYRQPQLFRRGCISYEAKDLVHENYFTHSKRPVGYLANSIWQVPFHNLSEMMHKANRYTDLGVERMGKRYSHASMGRALGRSFWGFIKHFVLRRGFLDGWPGFVIAMGAAYGTFYRHAKFYEAQKNWQEPKSPFIYRNRVSEK